MDFAKILSDEFEIKLEYSQNVITLLDEGNTIPFIARYRKEMHGTCDDQVLREFADRYKYLQNLDKRKGEVQASITEQGKWTEELAIALENAKTMTEVEDIYRPYKQKKKTRASIAIAKGLEPLADIIMGDSEQGDLLELGKAYINNEEEKDKKVASAEDAVQGAKDIVAERISDDANLRKVLRELLFNEAVISTKLDEEQENAKTYDMYKEFSEKVSTIPSHRILAINRGEKEDCLKASVVMNPELAYTQVKASYLKKGVYDEVMTEVAIDSYDRLIFPSLEREVRSDLTDKANEQAIKMFEVNLKPLLMQPPLKGKTILGVDPGYKTGCKVAVIDEAGNVLDTAVIYPTMSKARVEESEKVVLSLIKKHNVDVISIGNGTASKETEIFIAGVITKTDRPVMYAVVSEAGASVYSASKLAAEEFPDFDLTLRSAVSIARRLQDPLAELIKIDVKSIGVGQYQHDMPQNRLSEVLGGVVEDCVNSVGVDLNTASPSLLSYVAGLNAGIAKNIVKYRETKKFASRSELLKVSKLGPKAFEQCAGFLRITDGNNVLDNTAVHPEAYDATDKLLKYFGFTADDVKNSNLALLPNKVALEGKEKVAEAIGVGVPTLDDIVQELLKPGRDIRDSLPAPVLRSDLLSISDLKAGMELDGVVRNVIDFGVFVDIGVHQDGLVHISQIADGYIKHPSEVLAVNDKVRVKVLDVDLVKNKISLTMKTSDAPYGKKKKEERPPKQENKDFKKGGKPNNGSNNNNNKNFKGNKNFNNKNGNRPQKPQESLEDAVKRLQERFRLG
ncbi:MAG: RNA-binding transcriptional accessory protein [Clostridia bacterium]|nr:RNA-binding transcriptional accessory protein [Clostridia bacterium]